MPDRTCIDCGADISGLHGLAKRCVECRAYGPPQEARSCRSCGADISHMRRNAVQCSECRLHGPTSQLPRYCADCGADISTLHGLTLVCADCRVTTMLNAKLRPLEPFPGPSEAWRCECMVCGTEVMARHSNIKSGWGACQVCARASQVEQRRMPEVEAIALARNADLEPLDPFPGVMAPWRCRCLTCGEEVTPLLNNIQKGQTGCGWCSGRYVDPDERARTMRIAGLDPQEPYPGRHTPWRCLCMKCGQITSPLYGAVANGGGCGWCNRGGFRAGESAIVYLVAHDAYDAVKVGIANRQSSRLNDHRRYGWYVVAIVDVDGCYARPIEDDILRWWRYDLDLPIHLGPEDMPQGGWTETAAASEVDVAATMNRMRALARSAA